MKTIKTPACYKGTVIRLGNEKRQLVNKMVEYLIANDFTEINTPAIQFQETFADKVGSENNNLMFKFQDRKERNICLAPEYTAVIQKLAQSTFKYQKDVDLFYIQQCFRGERQQKGRWREFTQLGVEILNPEDSEAALADAEMSAMWLVKMAVPDCVLDRNVVRGLDYYKDGKGFEIRSRDGLQLCGGGIYEGGVGFAIGIDRVMLEIAFPKESPLTNEEIDTIEFAAMLDEAKKHTDENGLISDWGYRMPFKRKAK